MVRSEGASEELVSQSEENHQVLPTSALQYLQQAGDG